MTATVAYADGWAVTEPGIYDGMPAEVYHGDPVPAWSLSASGARLLLRPSCPAKYVAARKAPTKSMERGTAAHTRILGAGPELHVIDADDWRKQAVKDEAEQARADGRIPVLRDQAAVIDAMAGALAANRTARDLFAEGTGLPEQSLFWTDPDTGIWRRSRLDWLPHVSSGGLCIIADYKTSVSASPEAMRKAVANYGYHIQGATYCAAVEALRPGCEARFVLVVQETSEPYLVACYYLTGRVMDEARRLNREACEIFRDCTSTGIWPGYDPFDEIQPLDMPGWAYRTEEW